MSEDICVLMTCSNKPEDPEVVTRRDTRGKIVLHNKLFSRGSLTSRLDVKCVCIGGGGQVGGVAFGSEQGNLISQEPGYKYKQNKQAGFFSPNLAFRQSCLRLEVATDACPAAATSCVTVSL